jgi:hypothetical protein
VGSTGQRRMPAELAGHPERCAPKEGWVAGRRWYQKCTSFGARFSRHCQENATSWLRQTAAFGTTESWGGKMLKSFAAREFLMTSTHDNRQVLVGSGQFSTRTGPFSTQAVAHIQLRDLAFVSHASASGYLTTGVETRSSVPYAPTNHPWNDPSCADRRTGTSRSSSVSRLK